MFQAFEKAAKQITPPKTHQLPGSCPFLILNNTGISVKVGNSDTLRVSPKIFIFIIPLASQKSFAFF